ncbi:flagellar basal-body rod protein FlgB [Salsuginibacillus halophilus]|uniref:Flagellar basal body rod protein FlgB n=1 Tax=Salsuginibacillus halophilus TaxID=517424 RepID=A0A2P8HYF2_9BACI|nr:flagellar basal body rod protein FlgB [Salsuginibacillus halophilus]PSL51184.1 flagellar basal-body rod protein FlgB [Salsuginibacillus halophilus]
MFSSTSLQAAMHGLDGAAARQNSISNNISNVDTPNYSREVTSFKDTLNQAVQNGNLEAHQTNDEHIAFGTQEVGPKTTKDTSSMYNHNGNNVDMDREMANMAQNQIYYNALADRAGGQFTKIKTALQGG